MLYFCCSCTNLHPVFVLFEMSLLIIYICQSRRSTRVLFWRVRFYLSHSAFIRNVTTVRVTKTISNGPKYLPGTLLLVARDYLHHSHSRGILNKCNSDRDKILIGRIGPLIRNVLMSYVLERNTTFYFTF